MVDFAPIQHQKETPTHRHSTVERRHGVVVSHALLDASNFLKSARFQRMVFESFLPKHKPELVAEYGSRSETTVDPAPVPAAKDEERCREVAA